VVSSRILAFVACATLFGVGPGSATAGELGEGKAVRIGRGPATVMGFPTSGKSVREMPLGALLPGRLGTAKYP